MALFKTPEDKEKKYQDELKRLKQNAEHRYWVMDRQPYMYIRGRLYYYGICEKTNLRCSDEHDCRTCNFAKS